MDMREIDLFNQGLGFIKGVSCKFENVSFTCRFVYNHDGKEYICPSSSIFSGLLFAEYEFRVITQLKEGYMELKSTKNMELPCLENIDVKYILRSKPLCESACPTFDSETPLYDYPGG